MFANKIILMPSKVTSYSLEISSGTVEMQNLKIHQHIYNPSQTLLFVQQNSDTLFVVTWEIDLDTMNYQLPVLTVYINAIY